jgi:F0F1-type ATP synthase gamma subunit
MSLNQLKNKITTYQSTNKVTLAMRNIAAVKQVSLKHQLLVIDSNLLRVKGLFADFFATKQTIKPELIIIFGPKKGLCGGLARKILYEFLEYSFDNVPLVVIDIPLAKLLVQEPKANILACFANLEDQNHPMAVVLEFCKKQLVKLEKTQITIGVFTPNCKHRSQNYLQFEFDQQTNSILAFNTVLESSYLITRLTEEEKRVEAMTQASDNCQKISEATKLKYFKTRQTKITQEILEISN